jgi:hypothetical protein
MESLAPASPDRARAAVDEVLASETFARSEQLRNFLRYVCDRALAGQGKDINEYSVAVEALGKAAGFSPGDDSSVRRSAYELRQKLQKYYDVEKRDAAIRVELPKGSYTPRFVETGARPPEQVKRSFVVWGLIGALVLSLVAAAGLVLSVTGKPRVGVDPLVREAWAPLGASGGPVLISLGTSLHLVVRPYMTVVAEGLPKYPAPKELYPLFRQHRPLPEGVELSMHPVDNSVQVGHAQALAISSATLSLMGVPFQALPERSASAPAIRGRSAVLIADPQNSNTAAQELSQTPLTLEFDDAAQDVVVRERGGNAKWVGKRGLDKRYTEVYGLISMLPGEGEAAGPHRIVIFSGMTSVGAHGAADFFSRPEGLRSLLQHLRAEGYTTFPRAYQVVVKCTSNDTLLLSTEYAGHRVMAK